MGNKRDVIKNRLNQVFMDIFDDEDIKIFDEMTSNDVDEWDSLMHIVLVLAVEKEFGIDLNAKEVGELDNVGEMLIILEERATK